MTATSVRLRLDVRGLVQGVGFRPTVQALATSMALRGFVRNTSPGARVEIAGASDVVDAFVRALRALPDPIRIDTLTTTPLADVDDDAMFSIRSSDAGQAPGAIPLLDRAPCPRCLEELAGRAPGDQRRRCFAFIACAVCGPRAAIATALPWDRSSTTMVPFALCGACQRDHDDPTDHRCWAVGLSCPACGPRLQLLDADGVALNVGDDHDVNDSAVVAGAVARIVAGAIVAVLGVGGFQLWCRADDDDVVARLRQAKARPRKPLALVACDLDHARRLIALSDDTDPIAQALLDPAAPIVIAPRADANDVSMVCDGVAPGSTDLGVMLPPSPLHWLLAQALWQQGITAVVTSGNRHGEPQAIATDDAVATLAGIANAFVVHDRVVARRLDDSVVRVIDGAPVILRAGRGFAPQPVVRVPRGPPLLALGAHLKCAPAITVPGGDGTDDVDDVVLGAHVGNLDGPAARDALEDAARDLLRLYGQTPVAVVVDGHPDCGARAVAERFGLPIWTVQHHRAHAAAVASEHAAEHDVSDGVAIIFDGLGDGGDGTLWGGEWIDVASGARRHHLPAFPLLGGDVAMRDLRRQGLGLLVAVLGRDGALQHPWTRRTIDDATAAAWCSPLSLARAPLTTAAGRVFDAAAALLGIAREVTFEGEGAIALEQRARRTWNSALLDAVSAYVPQDLITDIDDVEHGRVSVDDVAARLHARLAHAVVDHAGDGTVVVGGGCFHNALLTDGVQALLRRRGRRALLPRRVPPGDGGLSVGQIAAVRRWGHVFGGSR